VGRWKFDAGDVEGFLTGPRDIVLQKLSGSLVLLQFGGHLVEQFSGVTLKSIIQEANFEVGGRHI
jgi:hypothetical protein